MEHHLGFAFNIDDVHAIITEVPAIPIFEQIRELIGKSLEGCYTHRNFNSPRL